MSCSIRERHSATECTELEGTHVRLCSCTYAPNWRSRHLEWWHSPDKFDPRCRKKWRQQLRRTINNAKRLVRAIPRQFRFGAEKEETSYDRLHSACYSLSDAQIDQVAKYAAQLNRRRRR